MRRINVDLGRVIDWVGGQLQWSLFFRKWVGGWVGGWISGHMGHSVEYLYLLGGLLTTLILSSLADPLVKTGDAWVRGSSVRHIPTTSCSRDPLPPTTTIQVIQA